MAPTRTAYVDESLRVSHGLYVLAAAVVADADADRYRKTLRALRCRGQQRLHWRNEDTWRRRRIIRTVRTLHFGGVVVIADGMKPRQQERARRQCIQRLLAELTQRGVTSVIFERRAPELDARDHSVIAALSRQDLLPPDFRARWKAAASDPLLWLADIAAGAASLAESGGEGRYWDDLVTAFSVERFTVS